MKTYVPFPDFVRVDDITLRRVTGRSVQSHWGRYYNDSEHEWLDVYYDGKTDTYIIKAVTSDMFAYKYNNCICEEILMSTYVEENYKHIDKETLFDFNHIYAPQHVSEEWFLLLKRN